MKRAIIRYVATMVIYFALVIPFMGRGLSFILFLIIVIMAMITSMAIVKYIDNKLK